LGFVALSTTWRERCAPGARLGLWLTLTLVGCSPGAAGVHVVGPAHPVYVRCHGPSPARHDARVILGLTVREANTIVRQWGCILREAETDGRRHVLTADRVSYRVDVAVMSDRVVEIRFIG